MKKQNAFQTLKRLLSYFKPYLALFLIALITSSLTGVANLLGTYHSGMVTDHLLEYAKLCTAETDFTSIKTEYQALFTKDIITLIIIYLSGVFFAILHNEIMVHLTQKVLYTIRTEQMKKMEKLPLGYFDTHPHGEVMTFFTNDIESLVQTLNDSIANIVLSFTNMIGTVICLFLINIPLSLIVVIFIGLMFVFMFLNARVSRRYFKLQQKALSDVNSRVEEDIIGTKVIKAFRHEKKSYEQFEKYNESWRSASENGFFHTQVNTPFFVSLSYLNFSISSICGIIALCTGAFGHLTFGGLQNYLVFTRNACQPFNYFTLHLNAILTALAGAERIFTFLDEKEENDQGKYKLKLVDETAEEFSKRYVFCCEETGDTVPLYGNIVFSHVSFSYVKGKEILHDVSFEVHPGKKVAFVGSTGAGKTTIISLLARFYPLDSGKITYDGIDIEDIALESLRRAISMVTQDTHLFTNTIADNIRYVRMHSTIDEVIKASKDSHADSFIRRLPKGYDTMIYDDGENLSEGQRQLLGITRASLNRPPLMILDEATSNIDTRSELLIQKDLKELMKGKSVIVIAHRLSTIQDADEIIVLKQGRIIERGTQEELMKQRGDYYNLYTGKVELS